MHDQANSGEQPASSASSTPSRPFAAVPGGVVLGDGLPEMRTAARAQKIAEAFRLLNDGWQAADDTEAAKEAAAAKFGAAVEACCGAGLHIGITYPVGGGPDPTKPTEFEKAPVFRQHCLTQEQEASDEFEGLKGVYLFTNDPDRVRQMTREYLKHHLGDGRLPNLAVHLHASGLLLADYDKPAEVAAYERALRFGDPDAYTEHREHGPTVRTPGKLDAQGNWVHSDGGHTYFVLPEGEEGGSGTVGSDPDKWSIIGEQGKYALLPGSVRTEGRYECTGARIGVAGPWLLKNVKSTRKPASSARGSRTLRAVAPDQGTTPLDNWGRAQNWGVLLTGDGWTETGSGGCGPECRQWQHPAASSARSAIVHAEGCGEDYNAGHDGQWPLHVFSESHPQLESGTYTIAQYVQFTLYSGDWAAFRSGEDIDNYEDPEHMKSSLALVGALNSPKPLDAGPILDGEIVNEEVETARARYDDYMVDIPTLMATPPEPPNWLEEGFIAKGRYYGLTAAAKSGKSILTYWMAGHWALGRSAFDSARKFDPLTVLYLDFENGPNWLRNQLTKMTFPPTVGEHLKVAQYPPLPALNTREGGKELALLVAMVKPDVIIIDTVSRTVSGDENSSQVWSDFYRETIMPIRRARPDITIIRLDHTGKDETKGARGSSQKMSDLETHWVLAADPRKRDNLTLTLERSRFDGYAEEIHLRRTDTPLGHVIPTGKAGSGGIVWDSIDAHRAEYEAVNATLDRLGAPNSISNAKAKDLLKKNGERVGSNDVLCAALRQRKDRDEAPGIAAGEDAA
ncbi:AAA family ATPase [Rhodococcus daqingensis]|uniref:AAA family ATPase n=1 Tax=Rhodococcus daqingensis TaxID=2479363 RepID=A0ABW2S3Y5_9NOCA